MIKGIDVSNWQSDCFPLTLPDTGEVVDFAFIQVTRGMNGINSGWWEQARWARDHGLAVGFYHFGEAGTSAADQAARFVGTLGSLEPGETLWYDWEDKDGASPTNAEKDLFIQTTKKLLPGRKVGLYCNVDFWKNRDTTDHYGDALWIASWGAGEPAIKAAWTVHQYSDGPTVDHNRARFPSREAMKVWGGKPMDPVLFELAQLRADFEALRSVVDAIREVMEVEPAAGDIARAVVDELARTTVDWLARRLES